MPTPRNEEQINSKAPIKMKFGDKEYYVPLLTLIPSGLWRLRLNAELGSIADNFKIVDVTAPSTISQGLTSALIQFPERLANLVFLYREFGLAWSELLKENLPLVDVIARFTKLAADGPIPTSPDFPRDLITVEATEEQFAVAFSQVMQVAYPFLPQLGTVIQVMKATTSPQSARFTN